MNQLIFENLLRDICNRINSPHFEEVKNGLPLVFEQLRFHFSLKPVANDDLLVVVAELGQVDHDTPKELLRDLLHVNLQLQLTAQICYAIDPATQTLLLIQQMPVQMANGTDIANFIELTREISQQMGQSPHLPIVEAA